MHRGSDTTELGLTIEVAAAIGHGPTGLAAFDDCLRAAGVANFNLVRLSSVIPPRSKVRMAGSEDAPATVDLRSLRGTRGLSNATWGDRLYAVWAFQSAQLLGEEAWAGVAWVQHPDDGRGLFVEHEGASELQVRRELAATLTHMCTARGLGELQQESVVVGTRCEGEPVGALVLAPYQISSWL